MAYTLYAPYPTETAFVIIPNPEFGDTERREHKLSITRTMDGDAYTSVTTAANKTYKWNLTLEQAKAYELWEFYKVYNAAKMRVVRPSQSTLIGYWMNNPLELEIARRAVAPYNNEAVVITMEFETIQ